MQVECGHDGCGYRAATEGDSEADKAFVKGHVAVHQAETGHKVDGHKVAGDNEKAVAPSATVRFHLEGSAFVEAPKPAKPRKARTPKAKQ